MKTGRLPYILLVCSCFAVCWPTIIHGQQYGVTLGIKVFPSLTKCIRANEFDRYVKDMEYRPSLNIGLALDIPFSRTAFSLETGLHYFDHGTRVNNVQVKLEDHDPVLSNLDIHYYHLGIPILAKFWFGQNAVSFGPVIDYRMYTKWEWPEADKTTIGGRSLRGARYYLDASMQFNISREFILSDRFIMPIELGFEVYDIHKNNAGEFYISHTWRLGIGISYILSRKKPHNLNATSPILI
jgi:hypothetical protein